MCFVVPVRSTDDSDELTCYAGVQQPHDNKNKFKLVHWKTRSKDKVCELHVNEQSNNLEWIGLPRALAVMIASRFSPEFTKKYPLMALRMVILDTEEQVNGFRSADEVKQLQDLSMKIKRTSPKNEYDVEP